MVATGKSVSPQANGSITKTKNEDLLHPDVAHLGDRFSEVSHKRRREVPQNGFAKAKRFRLVSAARDPFQMVGSRSLKSTIKALCPSRIISDVSLVDPDLLRPLVSCCVLEAYRPPSTEFQRSASGSPSVPAAAPVWEPRVGRFG